MLDNVKSSFVLNEIITYINEKRKLELVKYNRTLQNKLNINIINYRLLGKKYKIEEKNGKGKEYNINDELLFEGEYLNGKRNGKGKEYYNNNHLKFEGEFLNGKRNGKGKEYYFDGGLRFEGEYLNGKLWNGKGYDIYTLFHDEIRHSMKFYTSKFFKN